MFFEEVLARFGKLLATIPIKVCVKTCTSQKDLKIIILISLLLADIKLCNPKTVFGQGGQTRL